MNPTQTTITPETPAEDVLVTLPNEYVARTKDIFERITKTPVELLRGAPKGNVFTWNVVCTDELSALRLYAHFEGSGRVYFALGLKQWCYSHPMQGVKEVIGA